MNWTIILDAATGRAEALNQVVRRSSNECAALQTLLLLEEAPHPAAALVAVATVREVLAAPIAAALAPHVAPALAAWRADPQWAELAIDDAVTRWRFAQGVARMVGALHDLPAALRDAVAIVLRDGGHTGVSLCLNALGAAGWTALGEDQRAALLERAAPDDLGRVWGALTAAQRGTTARAAPSDPNVAASLVRAIGAAWTTTDPALRRVLIDAVARDPLWVSDTAPAWPGMTDDERKRLATPAITSDRDRHALDLLKALGAAGRATLTVEQRAALDARAMEHPAAWLVLAFRAADAGWNALTDDERAAVLAAAERSPWNVLRLLRDVGVAGWNAMSADEQARIAVAVRGTPDDLFRCPPALWAAVAGDALPPATAMKDAAHHWRAEDVDADLGGLPSAHQALVLALAPWRTEDAAKDSARIRRLRAAWNRTSADERVALVMKHPSVLATVAAAAHMCGGGAAVDVVGETVARIVTATGGAAAKRAVGAMLRTPARWRSWMIAFAPTDDDSSDVWAPWRAAARRGGIADVSLCARRVIMMEMAKQSRRTT